MHPIIEKCKNNEEITWGEYVEGASKTLSDVWHGDKYPVNLALAVMNQFITAGIMLDQLKKALYYGKNIEEVANLHQDYINEVLKLPPNSSITSSEDQWELNEEGRITLHAILGIATESVEMVEAIEKSISNNVEIDTVNLSEELGDLAWYIAALFYLELSGFNEPNLILRKNLLKLHKRFGDKFTFEKALNRDLVEERKILEA